MGDKYDLIVSVDYGKQAFRIYESDMPSIISALATIRTIYPNNNLRIGICPVLMHERIESDMQEGKSND